MCDIESAVCFRNVTIVDVDSILVHERSVGPFPDGNTSAAASQFDMGIGDPESTKAIEEICLAADDAVEHVCVA